MITLGQALQQVSERPHGRDRWIILWEIELVRATTTLPPVVFRMTSRKEPTDWPPGTSPPRATYYPFPFDQSPIEQTNEASLPAVDLAIDNTTKINMALLHAGDGFEGNRATLIVTNEAALAGPDYPNQHEMRWDFVIASAIATPETISFRLEQPNLLQRLVPADRFVARRCRFAGRFGGEECGYPVNEVAAFTSCGGTIEECIERGEDEALRRLPVLHPRRFGGFLGIPAQRGPA